MDALLELDRPHHADLEAEVQQQAANVVLDRDRLLLQELASGQQHPPLLAGEPLHVHGAKEVDPHHLGDATRVIAVTLVDLSFQKSFGVACLDTNHRQASVCQRVEEPLRELARLEPNPLEVPDRILQDAQQILRMRGDLDLTADLPRLVQDAHGGFFDRDVQSRIVFYAACLPLRFEAAASLYPQPGARHLQGMSRRLQQAEYPI